MNGVHDMGGMHGMGPIAPEKSEPVFHQRWESRVFGLTRAVGAWRKWNIDASRHARELIPPAEYLRMSYYERWLTGLVSLIERVGLATRAEIECRTPAADSPRATPALTPERAHALIAGGVPANRCLDVPARFRAGQRVRARNMQPPGHTRLPRYARGKLGTVERDRGVFVFPDSNAHWLGENPQHLYSVRFAAREVWGPQAPARDCLFVDLWDEYLEPA